MNIVEITVPLYEAAWLPWAVQYFFFIGLSTTASLLAAASDLGAGERWRSLQPAAMLLALSSAVVAPVALLADLAQPGRFWHFYAHFTPWSWMSIGSLLLPLYLAALFGYAGLWLRARLQSRGAPVWLNWLVRGAWSGQRLLPVLAGATVAMAIAIVIYTGFEVMIVRARPLWHTYWLPLNLALTALTGAAGGLLMAQRWLGGTAASYALSLRVLLAALLLTAFAAIGWAGSGWLLESDSFSEAQRLFQGFGYWKLLFFASAIAGAVLLVGARRALAAPQRMASSWWLGVLALLCAWSFRWTVLMDVQTVPKYGAGLYPYHLPLGSDGLLGIIGTFGLWVTALVVLSLVITAEKSALQTHDLREVAHG